MDTQLVYRLVLAVDVEKYSRRPAMDQLRVQNDLRDVLEKAADQAGLARRRWQKQVRGDGELAVLPPDVDVARVVGDFVRHLDAALAELNTGRAGRPLRLRVAIHHGTLAPGPFGPIGDAPIVVSRLLDAAPLRQALAQRGDGDLALVVSQSLYNDVVRTGFCSFRPADFHPIRVTCKGVCHRGQVYRPEPSPDLLPVI